MALCSEQVPCEGTGGFIKKVTHGNSFHGYRMCLSNVAATASSVLAG